MVQDNPFLIPPPSGRRWFADCPSPWLQDDIGLLVGVGIADKVTSIVNLTSRVDKIERRFEFQDADDYDFSCCLSSRTRAPTSAQSMVIALSCRFVNDNYV